MQALSSLQVVPAGTRPFSQVPVSALQVLLVHGLSVGAQVTIVVGSILHWPPTQAIEPLQRSSSLNPAQSSSLAHSQPTSLPAHVPATQVSSLVQGLPSEQLLPSDSGLLTQTPVFGTQEVTEQGVSPDVSHWTAVAASGTHWPWSHMRDALHLSPSSKTAQSAVVTQAHSTSLPPQVPAAHVSPVVQGFSSSQVAVFGELTHAPLDASQASSVQGLPSSQLLAAPVPQTPAEQVVSTAQGSSLTQGVKSLASPVAHCLVVWSHTEIWQTPSAVLTPTQSELVWHEVPVPPVSSPPGPVSATMIVSAPPPLVSSSPPPPPPLVVQAAADSARALLITTIPNQERMLFPHSLVRRPRGALTSLNGRGW